MSRSKPPVVSRNVIVRTAVKIGGQNDHAAVITRVRDDGPIDVTIFPAGEMPYPILNVDYIDSPHAGAITWRWPSGA